MSPPERPSLIGRVGPASRYRARSETGAPQAPNPQGASQFPASKVKLLLMPVSGSTHFHPRKHWLLCGFCASFPRSIISHGGRLFFTFLCFNAPRVGEDRNHMKRPRPAAVPERRKVAGGPVLLAPARKNRRHNRVATGWFPPAANQLKTPARQAVPALRPGNVTQQVTPKNTKTTPKPRQNYTQTTRKNAKKHLNTLKPQPVQIFSSGIPRHCGQLACRDGVPLSPRSPSPTSQPPIASQKPAIAT